MTIDNRLRPLRVAQFLLAVSFWVPVEKLFMTEIGFDAGLVAVMAAAYAAVVPIMEVPSGILADRWSRRGVMLIAAGAALVSVTIGALSQNVVTYIVSAMFLGVYFAMQSGTVDAIVYDTLLEETGSSADFERVFGRMQLIGSVALVMSALAGGVLAAATSTRMTYIVTIPFLVAGIVALLRFQEPTLHKAAEPTSAKDHVLTTVRAIAGNRKLLPVVAVMAMAAMVLQLLFEFGPLWLVALGASAAVFGPYTAGMVATMGIGGFGAGRIKFERPTHLAAVLAVLVASAVALTASRSVLVIVAAQIVLAAVLVLAGIYLTKVLHDGTPSSIRTGVASGVSTMSWLIFLPTALAFGYVSDRFGIHAAGWLVVGFVVVSGAILVRVVASRTCATTTATCSESSPVPSAV